MSNNNGFKGQGNGFQGGYMDDAFMDNWRKGNGQSYNNQAANREKVEVNIKPMEFDGENRTKTMRSRDLCGIIADVFGRVFSDFEGCIIRRNPQTNQPMLLMYFKEKKTPGVSDKLTALEPMYTPNQGVAAAFQNAQCRMGGKRYKLSLDAQDVLEKFIYTRKGQKINWGNLVSEIGNNAYSAYGYNILVQVAGFDIQKVLEAIYGKTIQPADAKPQEVTYALNIIKPLVQVGWNATQMDTEFLLTIQQLNIAILNQLGADLGIGMANSGVNMVRPH